MTLPIVERLRAEIGLAEAIGADITVSLLEQAADTIEELVEFVRRASRGSGQIAIVADELLAKIGEAR
jgi:hypothetical protein